MVWTCEKEGYRVHWDKDAEDVAARSSSLEGQRGGSRIL